MDYYKTSPEYVKIKLGEQKVESIKKHDILKMSLAFMIIMGMTFCAVTAFHISKSKPFSHFFESSNTGHGDHFHTTQISTYRSVSTEPDEASTEDSWVMVPYRIIVVHLYNPLFEFDDNLDEQSYQTMNYNDVTREEEYGEEEDDVTREEEYVEEEDATESTSTSTIPMWQAAQDDLAYFAVMQHYLASLFQN